MMLFVDSMERLMLGDPAFPDNTDCWKCQKAKAV